jgi:hypothetical protein
LLLVVSVLATSGPAWAFGRDYLHNRTINSMSYKREFGHWDTIELPKKWRINAVHATLLDTGKILITAGSGNDRNNFAAGTFKTLLWDPVTGSAKVIRTPTDMFCSVHGFLSDGKVLIAGGTGGYELLPPEVKNAAGAMTVKNEAFGGPRTFPKGTRFVARSGELYQSTTDFTVGPATESQQPDGSFKVAPSETVVFVEAVREGPAAVVKTPAEYQLVGLPPGEANTIYGVAQQLTLDKQDFRGTASAYVFDPKTEAFVRVQDMKNKRWYPTLARLPDGQLMAVSGLDGTGQILTGQNEIFDEATGGWTDGPTRFFPTYPALFPTADGRLFYSASNAGYGPADVGRTPGLWDTATNTFTPIPGLRDADETETSASVLLAPAQAQRFMVLGGGGVGESPKSTARTDIVDLTQANPHFTPGPDLPRPTRYPNVVLLPDDGILITGGSSDYRGKHDSDNHDARIYHPDTGLLSMAADPQVGRDYHSEALLLPDGRVVTMGSNPLFSNSSDSVSAPFEQRIEIYSPPYLFQPGERPAVTGAPAEVDPGATVHIAVPNAADIAKVRLIRPTAATHVTNLEQRSVAVDFAIDPQGLTLTVPTGSGLLPAGPYMLFVINRNGVPSVGRWVMVS